MVLDHLAPVIYRDKKPLITLVFDIPDDGFEKGTTANRQHRFRNLLRQRPKSNSEPSCHKDNPGIPALHAQDIVDPFKTDDPAFAIKRRHLVHGQSLHDTQRDVASLLASHRRRVAAHDFMNWCLKRNSSQQAASHIAIGDRGKQPALAIHDQRDLHAPPVDRFDGLQKRHIRPDQDGFQPRLHIRMFYLPWRGDGVTPTTRVLSATSENTSDPAPMTGPASITIPWMTT